MSGDVLDLTCDHKACEGKGIYTLPGWCSNCGVQVVLKLTRGHQAPRAIGYGQPECPFCGCGTIAVVSPAWQERP